MLIDRQVLGQLSAQAAITSLLCRQGTEDPSVALQLPESWPEGTGQANSSPSCTQAEGAAASLPKSCVLVPFQLLASASGRLLGLAGEGGGLGY